MKIDHSIEVLSELFHIQGGELLRFCVLLKFMLPRIPSGLRDVVFKMPCLLNILLLFAGLAFSRH